MMKSFVVLTACLALSCAQLLGSGKDISTEDAIVNRVAHFAVSSHPGDTLENGYYDALEKIHSVQKQTVAGTLYILELQVGASGCNLKGEYDQARCKVKAAPATRRCKAKVHVQVWLKPQNSVLSWECEK